MLASQLLHFGDINLVQFNCFHLLNHGMSVSQINIKALGNISAIYRPSFKRLNHGAVSTKALGLVILRSR